MAAKDTDHKSISELIPASMLSDFVYCPRQCYIKWSEGEFVDCEDGFASWIRDLQCTSEATAWRFDPGMARPAAPG